MEEPVSGYETTDATNYRRGFDATEIELHSSRNIGTDYKYENHRKYTGIRDQAFSKRNDCSGD